MSRVLHLVVSLLVSLAAVLATPNCVWAWCRSTTCKGASCAIDSAGCISEGHPLAWDRRCVGFSLQSTGTRFLPEPEVRAAIQKAFATWSTVICPNGQPVGLHLGQLSDTPCGHTEYDAQGPNVNAVLFRDSAWEYKGIDNNVAKTTVHYDPGTGVIHDADIEINTANNHFTVGDSNIVFDLQTVLTHEIGHFLGIAHSDNPWAVMAATYEAGSLAGRQLTDDDIAAVCALYPPDGSSAACDYTPEGGEDRCDGQATAGCSTRPIGQLSSLWWLTASAGLLYWRRWA